MNRATKYKNKARAITISRQEQSEKAQAFLFGLSGLLLSLLLLGAGRLIGP